MSTFWAGAVVAWLGFVLGSFFNVLIWRMPRAESIIHPSSQCPSCGRRIRAHENIPLLSYALLRGKCAGCGVRISPRYPLVELATGIATIVLWLTVLRPALARQMPLAELIPLCVQTATLLLLIPISLIDLDHMIIPDGFTLPGLLLAFGLSWLPGGITPIGSLIGLFTAGGILLLFGKAGELLFRKGEGMGGGDIKLMAWVGALWGWQTALLAIFLASFVGAFVGILLVAVRSLARDHRIPFGPFLAVGIWAAVLAGEPLVEWYLSITRSMVF